MGKALNVFPLRASKSHLPFMGDADGRTVMGSVGGCAHALGCRIIASLGRAGGAQSGFPFSQETRGGALSTFTKVNNYRT